MKIIIELEYFEKAVVAYFLDGGFDIYPIYESETLEKLIYKPDNLTVAKRIRSAEQCKLINDMIKFYFDNDALNIDYSQLGVSKK